MLIIMTVYSIYSSSFMTYHRIFNKS